MSSKSFRGVTDGLFPVDCQIIVSHKWRWTRIRWKGQYTENIRKMTSKRTEDRNEYDRDRIDKRKDGSKFRINKESTFTSEEVLRPTFGNHLSHHKTSESLLHYWTTGSLQTQNGIWFQRIREFSRYYCLLLLFTFYGSRESQTSSNQDPGRARPYVILEVQTYTSSEWQPGHLGRILQSGGIHTQSVGRL